MCLVRISWPARAAASAVGATAVKAAAVMATQMGRRRVGGGRGTPGWARRFRDPGGRWPAHVPASRGRGCDHGRKSRRGTQTQTGGSTDCRAIYRLLGCCHDPASLRRPRSAATPRQGWRGASRGRQPADSEHCSRNKGLQPLESYWWPNFYKQPESRRGAKLAAWTGLNCKHFLAMLQRPKAVSIPADDGLGDALDEALGEGRPGCVGGGADAAARTPSLA